MTYKYWQPIMSEEHRLFAKEVAEMWGLYSINPDKNNLHTKFAYHLLETEEYDQRKNPLYYETKHGLVRCFDGQTIQRALHRLHTFSHQEPQYFLYNNAGRTFKYRFLGRVSDLSDIG